MSARKIKESNNNCILSLLVLLSHSPERARGEEKIQKKKRAQERDEGAKVRRKEVSKKKQASERARYVFFPLFRLCKSTSPPSAVPLFLFFRVCAFGKKRRGVREG